MKTILRRSGDITSFFITELEPEYHSSVLDLYYQSSGEDFVKPFPADTPHLDEIYSNFSQRAEEMILLTARVRPAPWADTLAAYLEVIQKENLRWRMAGSVALAVRGIDVAPRDIDLALDNDGAVRLGELLQDCLVEPVIRTPGWIANWFGRAFLHARLEWIGVDDPYDLEGLEVVTWRGSPIRVPSVELLLKESDQRDLEERVQAIHQYLSTRAQTSGN